MMMMRMKHYTEPSPGFAATPKTIVTSPKDPAWTLGAKGVQGSGSSDEEEPFTLLEMLKFFICTTRQCQN